MKKLIFVLVVFCLFEKVSAQSHTFGTFSLQLGYDIGAHGTLYETKYNGTVLDKDTSAAVTTMTSLSAHFNLMKFLSVGLSFQGGKYIEDPDNTAANGNRVNATTFDLRLYPVNKDKFNWYIAFRAGASRLQINQLVGSGAIRIPVTYRFSGSNHAIFTGFNWYFANQIGMHFNIGYMGNNFKLQEYYINSTKQNISNYDNHLWTKGINFGLGLSLRIGGKD